MANTIIRRDDDAVDKTRRNGSNSAASRAATRLVLLILLVTTAVAMHSDGSTPRDDCGNGNNSGNVNDTSHFGDNKTIHEIDITKIDIDLLNNVAAQRNRTAKSIIDFQYSQIRNRWLTSLEELPNWTKGIVYWMYREQRVQDNWALLNAQNLAIKRKVPLHVVYCTPNTASKITLRQYEFMIQGLKEVESEFRSLNIPFHFLYGGVADVLPDFVINHNIGGIVVDFLPLRDFTNKTRRLVGVLNYSVPVVMVDAHNVIPCWTQYQSSSPTTIRRIMEEKLLRLLTEFPPVIKHPFNSGKLMPEPINWEETVKNFKIDRTVLPVPHFKPGYREGIFQLEDFMKNRLKYYHRNLKNPMINGLSNLSPWLHFGQISPQRAMLEIYKFSYKYSVNVKIFMKELWKTRERSDIFCYRNLERYDNVTGARRWARRAMNMHRNDTRKYTYTRDEFEQARTHDGLWNAAQSQMMIEGKMHRFLRMYWGKKILEWTDTPENALANAIYLNDKYSLDGNDPNGYSGCMWAICGVHDRPFIRHTDIPIFGPFRPMNLSFVQTQFDVVAFIKKYKHYDYVKE